MSDAFADQQLADFIANFSSMNLPSAADTGAEALRAATLERVADRPVGPDMHRVSDNHVGSTGPDVRVYRPTPDSTGVLVYFHGGGWTIGDLDTHDRACRRLAETSGVVVVAVDYRRAPEHRWPAAIDDAIAIVEWVNTGPDVLGDINGRVGVAGDSAGGLIAALASHRLRDDDRSSVPDAQLMIYSNTDLASTGGSMQSEGHGYGLDIADVDWFNTQFVPDRAMWTDPAVSPLHDHDCSGLPATYVITCEHDPLRDQGEQYASRTEQAGVPTVVRREPGMVHNFMLWDLVSPACAAAADRVARDVGHALQPRGRPDGQGLPASQTGDPAPTRERPADASAPSATSAGQSNPTGGTPCPIPMPEALPPVRCMRGRAATSTPSVNSYTTM